MGGETVCNRTAFAIVPITNRLIGAFDVENSRTIVRSFSHLVLVDTRSGFGSFRLFGDA